MKKKKKKQTKKKNKKNKQTNPCSSHEIHVLDFELLISQDGPCFVYVALSEVSLSP